jgi:hypothetical protein
MYPSADEPDYDCYRRTFCQRHSVIVAPGDVCEECEHDYWQDCQNAFEAEWWADTEPHRDVLGRGGFDSFRDQHYEENPS